MRCSAVSLTEISNSNYVHLLRGNQSSVSANVELHATGFACPFWTTRFSYKRNDGFQILDNLQQFSGPWKNGKKFEKLNSSFKCPSLLPGGSFQTLGQGGKTQTAWQSCGAKETQIGIQEIWVARICRVDYWRGE